MSHHSLTSTFRYVDVRVNRKRQMLAPVAALLCQLEYPSSKKQELNPDAGLAGERLSLAIPMWKHFLSSWLSLAPDDKELECVAYSQCAEI